MKIRNVCFSHEYLESPDCDVYTCYITITVLTCKYLNVQEISLSVFAAEPQGLTMKVW